ncbi:hypothetical protein Pyn_20727 [Prunus yedoensis var. nudiflora]|uniref:Uncharacterized protein n=1 Tax=Prunus yedoensis var. nudiflora TaxID=2094558 RepID=A0A314USK8_PRUYE|nr:hypothetical protein Pyn_20727 [Prunus yedoensis var. nudiflora]
MDSSMASCCFFNLSSMSFNIISLALFFDSQTSFLSDLDMSETSSPMSCTLPSESLKKEGCESKKRANEIILKDMEERLKKQQEAMEEPIASLRFESKVACGD